MLPSCHHVRRIKEERNLKSIKILYLELFYLTLEISAHFYRRLPIFSPHSRYLPKSNAISKLNFRQENLQHKLGQRMARYWNFAVHEKSIIKTKFCPCCQDLIPLRSYYYLILELLLSHHLFLYNINELLS